MMEKARRGRISHAKKFEDALQKLIAEGSSFSVKRLTQLAKLEESVVRRYLEPHEQRGTVTIGAGGGGGSIQPAKAKIDPIRVFISYSHKDEKEKIELVKHLNPFVRENIIDIWHDRKIGAGENIEKTIYANLAKSEIVIFLISIDFLNSEFCYDKELQLAFDLHKKKEIIIIPVVVRQCNWLRSPLRVLNAIPKDAKPIYSAYNFDEAMTDVAKAIADEASKVLAQRSNL